MAGRELRSAVDCEAASGSTLAFDSDTSSDGERLSQRARLVTAAVNFALTAYATVTTATMKMLHCVSVPGTPTTQQRLFIRSSLVCDFTGWQLPEMLSLVILLTAPVLLPFFAAWSRRPPSPGYSTEFQVVRGPGKLQGSRRLADDVRVGIRRALTGSYKPATYWWEAVLMVQRLVRVTTTSPSLHVLSS